MKELIVNLSCLAVALSAASALSGRRYENLIKLISTAVLLIAVALSIKEISHLKPASLWAMENEDTEAFFDNLVEQNTEEEIRSLLRQRLEAAGVGTVSIEPQINIDGSEGIYLQRVKVLVTSEEEISTAKRIIHDLIGSQTEVEVKSEGTAAG